jgi:hypothetical protein
MPIQFLPEFPPARAEGLYFHLVEIVQTVVRVVRAPLLTRLLLLVVVEVLVWIMASRCQIPQPILGATVEEIRLTTLDGEILLAYQLLLALYIHLLVEAVVVERRTVGPEGMTVVVLVVLLRLVARRGWLTRAVEVVAVPPRAVEVALVLEPLVDQVSLFYVIPFKI